MEPADMTCLLRVNTKTAGWQTTMIHVFQNIGGVYDFTIDADEGTAQVCGKVDPSLLLSVLAKSGKHAEIVWIHFDNQPPYSQYMQHGNGYGYHGNNSYLQYHGHGGMNDHGNNSYLQYHGHGGMNDHGNNSYLQYHGHGGMNDHGNNSHLQYHGHGGMNHHDQQLAYYHQPQPQNVQAPSKPPPTYKGLPPVKGKQYNGNVECCSVM